MSIGVWLAILMSAGVGFSLGSLGSGGSILALPILVYVARFPGAEAVPLSLVVVGSTAMFGAVRHLRRGNFHGRAALIFSASSVPAAFAGSHLTPLVPQRGLLLLFAALMIAAGGRMLTRPPAPTEDGHCSVGRCVAVGVAVGFLTGFLGVGGGFLILPALVLFAGIDMKRAIGTSLAVIAASAFAGFAGQLRNASIDWTFALAFTISALVGLLSGVSVAERLSAGNLRRAFALLIVGLGLLMAVSSLLDVGLPEVQPGERATESSPSMRPAQLPRLE